MTGPTGTAPPPMPPLPGAATGVPPLPPLTPISTREAAHAALHCEAATDVTDPAGMRRLWVRDAAFLLVLPLFVAVVWVGEESLRGNSHLPPVMLFLLPMLVLVQLLDGFLTHALTRTQPAPGLIPRAPVARWRWYAQRRRHPATLTEPAPWPAGAQAFALLAGAASVESVAPSWLCERVGLPAEAGAAWVSHLRWNNLLAGGGHTLGIAALPELHVKITPAGWNTLHAERARLTALAAW